MNSFETNVKTESFTKENLSKGMQDGKRSQTDILELVNAVTAIKKTRRWTPKQNEECNGQSLQAPQTSTGCRGVTTHNCTHINLVT